MVLCNCGSDFFFFCHLQELADGVICVCIVAAISHLSVMLSRAISHLSTCHDEKAFVEKWEYVPYKTDIHKIVILLSACCANFTAKKMSKDELSWLELQQLISQMSWKWIDCYFDNELYHLIFFFTPKESVVRARDLMVKWVNHCVPTSSFSSVCISKINWFSFCITISFWTVCGRSHFEPTEIQCLFVFSPISWYFMDLIDYSTK